MKEDFTNKYIRYRDEFDLFLMWCLDNNGVMTQEELNFIQAEEFRRKGLDKFFNFKFEEDESEED